MMMTSSCFRKAVGVPDRRKGAGLEHPRKAAQGDDADPAPVD